LSIGGRKRAAESAYSFSPPTGVLDDAEVILVYRDVTLDGEQLRTRIERDIDDLEKHVGWVRTMCEEYNRDLPVTVREWVRSRKERLLQQRNMVASIGLPMRQRDGDEPLLRVPVERRQVAVPRAAPIMGSSFVAQPEMADMLDPQDRDQAFGVAQDHRSAVVASLPCPARPSRGAAASAQGGSGCSEQASGSCR
jgi:hypothetical protein